MSLSIGLQRASARIAAVAARSSHTENNSEPAQTAAALKPGAQHPLSLRFVDPALERRYQVAAGAESLSGLRIITSVAAAMWLIAAFVVPAGTPIPMELAAPVCYAMAGLSGAALLATGRTETVDQQHLVASILTAANALVILWLASIGGVLPGYGMSAIMLLFAYGAVSRTGFIFVAWRSAVVVIGFIVAVVSYRGPGSLVVDGFFFAAAVIGSLLAMRLLEQSRRRVFYQDAVITQQADHLRVEKGKSDRLLLNVLPASISARLRDGEQLIADEYPSVTVLFADLVGFTSMAARLRPAEVVDRLGCLFARFDELVADCGLEKIKTMGDAYMAAGGLPEPLHDHAARVVDLGLAMIEIVARHGNEGLGLPLRIGVHSGPVIGGVIGHRKFTFDVWGDTVNVASRLESQGVPNRVHISQTTWMLVNDRFAATARGPVDLRGHGPMETYLVGGRQPGVGSLAMTRPEARAEAPRRNSAG